MARPSLLRKVIYFEPDPAAPRAQHHHRVDVGRSAVASAARCASNVAGSTLPAVIRPVLGGRHPRTPERLDEEELAD
jgi:hypothetical protein